jgi:hypothetical protein
MSWSIQETFHFHHWESTARKFKAAMMGKSIIKKNEEWPTPCKFCFQNECLALCWGEISLGKVCTLLSIMEIK